MTTLRVLATYEITLIISALSLVVAGKLLNGDIDTGGLLQLKTPASPGQISPARVQLLLVTLAGAWQYLVQVLQHYSSHTLPDLPNELLAVFAGSHTVYLASKAIPAFLAKPSDPGH